MNHHSKARQQESSMCSQATDKGCRAVLASLKHRARRALASVLPKKAKEKEQGQDLRN